MTMQFTPGPWRVEGPYVFSNGRTVARFDWQITDEVDRANARLIAAGPKLYETLAVIVANAMLIPDPATGESTDCYAVPIDDIEAAIAALAKARGETAQPTAGD